MKDVIRENNIGICLGGGGALGFAHIGVLKALEEHGVSPYHISGASMGAIIGVIYAYGYPPDKIMQIIEEHKLYSIKNIVSLSDPNCGIKTGVSGHKSIEKLLRHYITQNDFAGLKRRFHLSVVDLRNAESLIISSGGNLIEYVLASMSLPLAFDPEIIDGKVYIDGGMMNSLPVEPLLDTCNTIIGVDVQTAHHYQGKITASNMLPLVYRIMQKQLNSERRQKCDIYISFPELNDYGASDFSKYREIYDIGYRGATEYIQSHPQIGSIKSKGNTAFNRPDSRTYHPGNPCKPASTPGGYSLRKALLRLWVRLTARR